MRHYSTSRLLLLVALFLGWTSVSAQNYKEVKKWDLTVLSQATLDNLAADAASASPSWYFHETDDNGVPKRYKNKVVTDGATLKANGIEIEETKGLLFPAGLSAPTDSKPTGGDLSLRFNYGDNGIQVGSSNKIITIQDLKKDQKVEVVIKSASSSNARGISEVTNLTGTVGEATYVDGTADNTYDFTVNADGDATFKYNGGIIVKSITVLEEASTPKVAYVFKSDYSASWSKDTDPIFAALSAAYEVTEIDVLTAAVADIESLLDYDLVYSSEAVGGTHAYGIALKELVNRVPMLNQKSFYYASGRWGWGAGKNPSPTTGSIVIEEAYLNHAIFKDLTVSADRVCELFSEDTGTNMLQAYEAGQGSVIENDPVLAKAGEFNAIHIHGDTDNLYMLVPISSDGITKMSANGIQLVMNAAQFLIDTKVAYVPPTESVSTPVIDATQKTASVEVTITCATEGATIHYTVDGTEPTTLSPVYSAPFEIAAASATVKAMGVKENMLNSEIATQEVTNANFVAKEKLLVWTNFRDQPADWGADGDIIAAGTTGEETRGTFKVGSTGQRLNRQTTGASLTIGADYGPANAESVGVTSHGLKFLKSVSGGYIIAPEALEGPFDVTLWWTGAKGASYTEKMSIAVKTEAAEDWTEIGVLSTIGNKKIVKQSVSYTGSEKVLVRVMSVSTNGGSNDAFIFDFAVTGVGEASVVETPAITSVVAGDLTKQTVTIKCEGTPYAAIYYTTDGSEPTAESTPYTASFDVVGACTVKAIAFRAGLVKSVVATAELEDPVGINADVVNKEIVSRTFVTPSGIELAEPAQGLNVVKTTYSDGSVVRTKVIIK